MSVRFVASHVGIYCDLHSVAQLPVYHDASDVVGLYAHPVSDLWRVGPKGLVLMHTSPCGRRLLRELLGLTSNC